MLQVLKEYISTLIGIVGIVAVVVWATHAHAQQFTRFYCNREEAAEQVAVASVMGDGESVALPLIEIGMCHYIREVDENGKAQDPVTIAIVYVGRIFSDQFVVVGFEYDNVLRYAVMPVHSEHQRQGSI